MAWITPSSGTAYDGRMPDDEKVRLRLTSVTVGLSTMSFEGKPPEQRAELKWITVDPQYQKYEPMDWVGLRLGKLKNGTPSKMRQLINAITKRPPDAEVAGLDSETLEFATTAEGIDGQIKPGVEVDAIGETREETDNGEVRRSWRITKYRAVAAAAKTETVKQSNGRPPVKVAPATADFATSEAGF